MVRTETGYGQNKVMVKTRVIIVVDKVRCVCILCTYYCVFADADKLRFNITSLGVFISRSFNTTAFMYSLIQAWINIGER